MNILGILVLLALQCFLKVTANYFNSPLVNKHLLSPRNSGETRVFFN